MPAGCSIRIDQTRWRMRLKTCCATARCAMRCASADGRARHNFSGPIRRAMRDTRGRKRLSIESAGVADRDLHIGIDARELAGHPTGVGRYLSGLLNVWASDTGSNHRFTLFTSDAALASAHTFGPRFSVVVEPSRGHGSTWWEQTRVLKPARHANLDVWFSPGYTSPLLMHCPVVVAIHDVSFFAHPEWFGGREGFRR